jgi:hypothetical protein
MRLEVRHVFRQPQALLRGGERLIAPFLILAIATKNLSLFNAQLGADPSSG